MNSDRWRRRRLFGGSGPGGGWLWRPLLGAALSQLVLGIVRPTMSYAGLEHDADGFAIGALAAAFAVVPMFVALPVGAFAGRWKHIGLVPAASALLLLAGCVWAVLVTDLAGLLMAAALLGVANLGVLLGAQSWVSRSAPPARYNEGFGWMTAGMSLGQALGPLCAGLLIGPNEPSEAGIALAFWVAAAVAAVLVGVFATTARRSYSQDPGADPVTSIEILRTPGVSRYMLVSASVLTSVDILTAYLPVLGGKIGISPVLIGLMLAVRGISSTLSRLCLGVLARRFAQSPLIIASVVGAALCLVVVALVPNVWALFAALAVGGFFLGIGQPVTMTAVALALPERARSSGLAMRLLGNRVAQTATPLLAGASVPSFGVSMVFLIQTLGLAASAVWELTAARRSPRVED